MAMAAGGRPLARAKMVDALTITPLVDAMD
jgi:hypothetical protein